MSGVLRWRRGSLVGIELMQPPTTPETVSRPRLRKAFVETYAALQCLETALGEDRFADAVELVDAARKPLARLIRALQRERDEQLARGGVVLFGGLGQGLECPNRDTLQALQRSCGMEMAIVALAATILEETGDAKLVFGRVQSTRGRLTEIRKDAKRIAEGRAEPEYLPPPPTEEELEAALKRAPRYPLGFGPFGPVMPG